MFVLCCVFAGSFMQVLCHLDDTVTFNVKYVNKTLHYCPEVEIAGIAVESQRFD